MMDKITALLTELARARADLQPQIDALELECSKLMAQAAELRQALQTRERETREFIEAYVRETGDLTPHPAVTIRRKSKLQYDRGAALDYAREHAPDCVRVKEELDVRAFEKACSDWPGAERVNVIEVAIAARLGDLLIVEGQRSPAGQAF